jgi:hypothetical protein
VGRLWTDPFTAPDGTELQNYAGADFGIWTNLYGAGEHLIYGNAVRVPGNDPGSYDGTVDALVLVSADGFDVYMDQLPMGFEDDISGGMNVSISLVSPDYSAGWSITFGYAGENYIGVGWGISVYEWATGHYVIDRPSADLNSINYWDVRGGPFRWGIHFGNDGIARLFAEPVGGGARTYVNGRTGAPCYGAWSAEGIAGTQLQVTVQTTALCPNDGWIDNLSVQSLKVSDSSITAAPDSIEAGPARSAITVTAKDDGGLPIMGATIVLSATGTDNTITQPTAPTDANGQAVGYLSSTKAEVKTVSATVNGSDLGVTVDVTVTPGPPDPTFSYLDPSSLHTNVLAGGTGIGIWIRDQYGNGVAGETPGVAVGGGTVTDPVPTGGDGGTTTTYTPPTDSGPQTLTVTLGAVHLELPIEVDAGPLDHFGIAVPAEVMLGGQTVASCAAEDLYGNVVTGFTGQLDLTATGSRLLATPIRTAAFDAGVGFPALVFLDLATGVRVHGAEVRGAHSGVSNLFAVIEPWAPPAHPPGGSFTSGAGASGVWQPVPDREWEDRDG